MAIDRRGFLQSGAMLALLTGELGAMSNAFAAQPVVNTKAGKVRGRVRGAVLEFLGLAYAASTAGARFLPPRSLQPWAGIKDALGLGARSPQQPEGGEPPEVAAMDRREAMGEDCLVLNVWTRSLTGAKRPVMVWLHGGGFESGSAGFKMYDGANLAEHHDVVFVGVNHRLNAFGYLYLGDTDERFSQSGNVGQLDIVAALIWIRDNIAAFGGDPANVTVMGESGGGAKVSTLLAMPAARGLFHKAIVQSGGGLKAKSKEHAKATTARLFEALKIAPGNVQALQALPFERLVEAMAPFEFGLWGPVFDGGVLPVNLFEPAAPEISADIPLLVGSNETETAFFPDARLDPIDAAELRRRLVTGLRLTDASADELIAVYRRKYPSHPEIDIHLKVTSDNIFGAPALEVALRKAVQPASVYQYYFKWRSPVRGGVLKSFHSLEIPFALHNVDAAQSMTGTGKDRYDLERRMSSAWVAFARTGNPNHSGLPQWPRFDATQRMTMLLDDECRVVGDPNGEEVSALARLARQTS